MYLMRINYCKNTSCYEHDKVGDYGVMKLFIVVLAAASSEMQGICLLQVLRQYRSIENLFGDQSFIVVKIHVKKLI